MAAPRRLLLVCVLAASAARGDCVLAQAPAADTRPTVAVMDFANASVVRHADYEALGKGISGMLYSEIGMNPSLRVLERENVQRLIEEQKLDASGRVSAETAVQVGRLLGVHHMVFGTFVVNSRGRMRLDTRTVDVQTSQIEFVATTSGDADDVSDLVADVGRDMNERMKLPPLPSRAPRPTAAPAVPKDGHLRVVMLYSRALAEQDRGNREQALELCRAALSLNPDFQPAQQALVRLSGKT